ncbi:cytidyltransferase [Saccharopolyspora sp. WRP15-2]|uniref:FAD synthase n=1 Tax=Saccharopolyspora oryzae TaxID=2997343 RepID=A0ABT4UWF5_9PSEU|nr:cytidyltransferase [Saccharopolyspora oryzae]MDA3626040.1 cytidyltransferase [Saccharopolyspora oryzae]
MTAATTSRARLWRGLGDIPAGRGPCVTTLGVFDGVHRGHAHLIGHAVRRGRALGLPAVMVTFDPHPARVVGAPRDTAALTTVEWRAELACDLGVDAVLVLPFTRGFAQLPPASFVEQVLASGLRTAAVVVGANFTFGHRGSGTTATLHELGADHGFTAHEVPLVQAGEAPHSSTRIRECLRRGDVRAAARALGRPHRIDGHVSGGMLRAAAGTAIPAEGRYSARTGNGQAVDVEVRAGEHVALPGMPSGPASIEFLARLSC